VEATAIAAANEGIGAGREGSDGENGLHDANKMQDGEAY
jgi:hypothetical protein